VEFDPAKFVGATEAAKLLRVSLPRVFQLRDAGELRPLKTPVGQLFAIADCVNLRHARERRRALATLRRGKP
jgi:hypothetical protein